MDTEGDTEEIRVGAWVGVNLRDTGGTDLFAVGPFLGGVVLQFGAGLTPGEVLAPTGAAGYQPVLVRPFNPRHIGLLESLQSMLPRGFRLLASTTTSDPRRRLTITNAFILNISGLPTKGTSQNCCTVNIQQLSPQLIYVRCNELRKKRAELT